MTRSPGTAGGDFPKRRTSELTSKDKLGFAKWWRGRASWEEGTACAKAQRQGSTWCVWGMIKRSMGLQGWESGMSYGK